MPANYIFARARVRSGCKWEPIPMFIARCLTFREDRVRGLSASATLTETAGWRNLMKGASLLISTAQGGLVGPNGPATRPWIRKFIWGEDNILPEVSRATPGPLATTLHVMVWSAAFPGPQSSGSIGMKRNCWRRALQFMRRAEQTILRAPS